MALLDQYNLAYSGIMSQRVCAGAWKSASYILIEDTATANHANRVLWANAVLNEDSAGPMIRRLRIDCAQNPSIASAGESCSDNDIEYVIATRIDVYANGVYGA